MLSITRRYSFEAAHWLPKVHEDHKCHRVHGHNYEIEVTVTKPIQDDGFLIDFWDLDKVVAPLVEMVDHRTLNDIPGLQNPTAELIAGWFVDRLPNYVSSVKVFETKDCWANQERETIGNTFVSALQGFVVGNPITMEDLDKIHGSEG